MEKSAKVLNSRLSSNLIDRRDRVQGSGDKHVSKGKETFEKNEIKREEEEEEEKEKGWSDMTETEGSDSNDDPDESKLVIDVSSKLASKDLDSTRVRSLEETMKFLQGNTTAPREFPGSAESVGSMEDESDEEIIFSSSGAPDKYGFLTEIYVPKMRGFEDLSDRCILDSVSVNLTLDQVVRSSMDQFNYHMRNTELTDTQREITKYVRRRARNRVSARKSRMKKISDIVRLSSEIRGIQEKKCSLTEERDMMEKLKESWTSRVSLLQDYILQYLKDHGETEDVSLVFNDGAFTIAKNQTQTVQSTEIKVELNPDDFL